MTHLGRGSGSVVRDICVRDRSGVGLKCRLLLNRYRRLSLLGRRGFLCFVDEDSGVDGKGFVFVRGGHIEMMKLILAYDILLLFVKENYETDVNWKIADEG